MQCQINAKCVTVIHFTWKVIPHSVTYTYTTQPYGSGFLTADTQA